MLMPWLIGGSVAAVGLLVAVRGLIGRGRERVARCRGCGHQVTAEQAAGRVRPNDRCPECGRDLGGRGITVRRVHRPRVVAGALLVAMGLGGAAAWPDAGTRIARAPGLWLLAVERPIGGPAAETAIITELADRRDRGRLSDDLTARLAAEFVARLRAGGSPASLVAAGIDAAQADAWYRLCSAAFAAGRLPPADLEPLVDAAVVLSLRVAPAPPSSLAVTVGTGSAFRPAMAATARTRPPGGAPRAALPPLTMTVVSLRHDGQETGQPGGMWGEVRNLTVPVREGRSATWRQDALTPRIPVGEGTVELDVRLEMGAMTWTRTLSVPVVMPGWPPAGFEAADAEVHRRLLLEPPVLLVGRHEQLRAAGVDPMRLPSLDRVGGDRMLGVVELRYDPSVVQFDRTFDRGRHRIFHEQSAIAVRTLTRGLRSGPRARAAWSFLIDPEAEASLPADGAVVDLELPFTASLWIEMPAERCDPPPAVGQAVVRGRIDPPAGGDEPIRLSGVVLRRVDAAGGSADDGGP